MSGVRHTHTSHRELTHVKVPVKGCISSKHGEGHKVGVTLLTVHLCWCWALYPKAHGVVFGAGVTAWKIFMLTVKTIAESLVLWWTFQGLIAEVFKKK